MVCICEDDGIDADCEVHGTMSDDQEQAPFDLAVGERLLAASQDMLLPWDWRRERWELFVEWLRNNGEALVAALKAKDEAIDYWHGGVDALIDERNQLRADLATAQHQADQWLVQSAYCRKCHIWTRRKDVMHNFPPVCPQCKETVTYGALTDQLKLEDDLVRVEAKRDKFEQKWRDLLVSEHALSDSYVRIRRIVGAYDFDGAGKAVEEMWRYTEAQAEQLQAHIAEFETERDSARSAYDILKMAADMGEARIAELEGSMRWLLVEAEDMWGVPSDDHPKWSASAMKRARANLAKPQTPSAS